MRLGRVGWYYSEIEKNIFESEKTNESLIKCTNNQIEKIY